MPSRKEEYMHIDIIKKTESLIKETFDNTVPQDGILKSYKLQLPEYVKIAYFARDRTSISSA